MGIFGAIGALVFSGLTQRNQNKSQHYQIFKDFDEKMTALVEKGSVLGGMDLLPFEQLRLQPPEILQDVETYRWKYLEFHENLAHLALTKIIPKSIAEYYNLTFAVAYRYIELEYNPDLLRKELNNIMTWCNMKGIKPSS
ncbi:MAG: hypothetical protein KGH83_03675 [Thaumarchaeota archaeon]|nr:hypothetical protein [Nitrososphaerota archaeon]